MLSRFQWIYFVWQMSREQSAFGLVHTAHAEYLNFVSEFISPNAIQVDTTPLWQTARTCIMSLLYVIVYTLHAIWIRLRD